MPATALRLDVRTSGIWQLNSVVLSSAGRCLLVDPGYFPRELSELAALVRELGASDGVVFTHGHWDHVMGWQTFAPSPVWCAPTLALAARHDRPEARGNLAEAADFDGRWYIQRHGPYVWPDALRALDEGERLVVGDTAVEALLLPGHSADGLALRVPSAGLLVAGDYLSPCEIPFIADLGAYRATLCRLLTLLDDVETVIPGHGAVLDRGRAIAIARADREYLDALADAGRHEDPAVALAIPLPRAADVPGMRDHHAANCGVARVAMSTPAGD